MFIMMRFFGLSLLFLLSIGIASYKVSYAFFSDAASSTNNTFAAAATFPTGTISPTPTDGATPTPPEGIANHLVISEVQITGGTGATTNDFIELYNPTLFPIDLNGYRLVKRSTSAGTDTDIVVWNSSTIISSRKFYLWANSAGGFSASVSANISSTDSISTNDSIAIRSGLKDSGTIIDTLAWGSGHTAPLVEGPAFPTNPTGNQSLERKALSSSTAPSMAIGGADEFKGNGYDNGDNATDFVLRTLSQPQNSTSSAETL